MAMADQALGAPRFSVGDVLNDSFAELFRRFGFYVLITLIFSLPNLLMGFLIPLDPSRLQQRPEEIGAVFATIGLFLVVSLIAFTLLYAALIYAAAEGRRGRDPGFGETLRAAVGRGVYLLPTAILQTLMIAIGLLLLIVPGVIAILYSFAMSPAAVMERVWPISSLSRSARLTQNRRWAILGLVLIFILIMIVVSAVTSMVMLLTVGIDGLMQGETMDLTAPRVMAATLINAAIQLPFTALGPILGAVAYVALAEEKDGSDPGTVTEVFR